MSEFESWDLPPGWNYEQFEAELAKVKKGFFTGAQFDHYKDGLEATLKNETYARLWCKHLRSAEPTSENLQLLIQWEARWTRAHAENLAFQVRDDVVRVSNHLWETITKGR